MLREQHCLAGCPVNRKLLWEVGPEIVDQVLLTVKNVSAVLDGYWYLWRGGEQTAHKLNESTCIDLQCLVSSGRLMRPPGTQTLAPIDKDSWHCYVTSFVHESNKWVQVFLESEDWERRLLRVKRGRGMEWVQGHRKWVFQSDDPKGIRYRFSGIELQPQPYSDTMEEFVAVIRKRLNALHLNWFTFNSVLMYLYDSPHDHCRNHKEDEAELGSNPTIGYLGLGERRSFVWSAETAQNNFRRDHYSIQWSHGAGDLLIMGGTTQERWYHCIEKAKDCDIKGPRIGCLLLNIIPDFHSNALGDFDRDTEAMQDENSLVNHSVCSSVTHCPSI